MKKLSRVRLCDSMDCSPPGSSVHGILQARILEWVAISFPRGSSRPRDRTHVSHTAGRRFTSEPPGKPNVGNLGSVPGWGRSPGEGNGYLLQYSCLENPMDGGQPCGYSPWGRTESDTTEHAWRVHLLGFPGGAGGEGPTDHW